MKKTKRVLALRYRSIFKLLLLMKFTIALLLLTTWQASAKSYSQDRITLKLQSTELRTALRQIEKKSVFRFLYNDQVISAHKKVDINADNALVTDILDGILSESQLTYKVLENNLVVITQKDFVVQETKVTGKVKGADGQPIPSVTVKIKGSNVATATDANGGYSISVPDGATIVFSSVGYVTQEIAVKGRTEIDVVLQIGAKDINEVVVTGYGTASKRDLTGSIVKVSGKEVADKPNTNPVSSLQGKVAGLSVVNNGTPGAAPDIRIRGTVSIGNVHPLYVVDGIFNDNIDYINPNDIESIDILKDPSSLAIFGVKGATGVIAITTKKAKTGQTTINLNTSIGFKNLVDKIKMADASQFSTLFAEEMANDGKPVPDYSAFNSNTDWVSAVTQKNAMINTNNLSISSSTQNNRFNFGLGYTTDEGLVIHEKLSKLMVSFADEAKLSKAIKIGINFNTVRIDHPYDATSRLDDARKVQPQVSALPKSFRVVDPYGVDTVTQDIYSSLALQGSGVVNPVLEIENTWNKTKNIEYRYVGSFYTDINFSKELNFRATWYGDMSNVNKRVYAPLYYTYTPYDNSVSLYNNSTSVVENSDDYRKFQQDYILNYKKSFGDHHLTATAGFTTYYSGVFQRQTKVKQGTSASDSPIPNDPRFWYISSGFGSVDPANTNSVQNEYSTVSLLGRLLYNYQNKYYFNASLRNDASSRLAKANRDQQFWSLGAAWELTKEDFMRNVQLFDFLKLKGSMGVLGNQTASTLDGSPINYPAYPTSNNGIFAVFGNSLFNAAQPAYIANPDLKWETVDAAEVGVEAEAFKHHLHFEFNYYTKTTKNLMTYVDRSDKGLPNELINGGSLKNWGEEFSAIWSQNFNQDLSINIAGNITFLKNKVVSLAADLPSGFLSRTFMNNGSAEARSIVGQPIGSFYGYEVAGLYQSYADVLASPPAGGVGGAYGPGDFKFRDLYGAGHTGGPDGTITSDDRTIIGNPTPKFTYGGSVSVTYKKITLAVEMGGVYGNDVFRTWGSLESPYQRVNYPEFKINRWHGAGTSNWDPINSQGHRFNYNGSTYNIEDGSYFRIRNLQLGYNFDQKLLAKAKISSLRIFGNIQNLKTWKHNSGYTPEFGGDATAFGFDFAGGAIPMITSFGLNVTF